MHDPARTIRILVLARMLLQALEEQSGRWRSSASLRSELVALQVEAEEVLEHENRHLRVIEAQAEGSEPEIG